MPMPTNLDTTDHYDRCEAAIRYKLTQLTDFFPNSYQVHGNKNKINKGAKYWAFFIPGTFGTTKVDAHNLRVVWNVRFDIYIRYKTEEEALGLFKAVRSAIFNWLHSDPTLSRDMPDANKAPNVSGVVVSAVSDLLQDIPGDNPNWLIQPMVAQVTQRVVLRF